MPRATSSTRSSAARSGLASLSSTKGVASRQRLPNLFAPFARGANTASADGYGLGLAIARPCVKAHGGTICADNRPGGGLCVEIVLPWPRNPAAADPERRQ